MRDRNQTELQPGDQIALVMGLQAPYYGSTDLDKLIFTVIGPWENRDDLIAVEGDTGYVKPTDAVLWKRHQ